MTIISVTLVYEDSTTWFAGTFLTDAAADAWIAAEKAKPYWKQTTQVQKTVITLPTPGPIYS